MSSRLIVLLIAAALDLACRGSEPRTVEEKKARGDQILREMSNTLAGLKTFSFTADEVSDKVGPGSQKTQARVVRHVVVRRPDGIATRMEGDQGLNAWYDGKKLTLVSDAKKLWARGPAPSTLDETIDYAAAVYDLKLPWGDLLYSSPYEAFMTSDTTGGWVAVETIDGVECDHLSYQQPVVDWQVWVTRGEHRPKQLQITYKQDPGEPVTRVTFRDLNPSASVDEGTFAAKVPDGYTRIPLARRDSDLAPIETAEASPAPAATTAATPVH